MRGRPGRGAAAGLAVSAALLAVLFMPRVLEGDYYEFSDPLVFFGLPLLAIGAGVGALVGVRPRGGKRAAGTTELRSRPATAVRRGVAARTGRGGRRPVDDVVGHGLRRGRAVGHRLTRTARSVGAGAAEPGQRCCHTVTAERTRSAARPGMRIPVGTAPSSRPPARVPVNDPAAIAVTNCRFSPSTTKLESRE